MSPTGTEIGCPGVPHLRASLHAVGRLQRDSPNEVVADVQLNLHRHAAGLTTHSGLDRQRVVDVGHLVDGEFNIDNRADDPRDAADAASLGFGVLFFNGGGHLVPSLICGDIGHSDAAISLGGGGCLGEGTRSADDLGDFLGDLGLSGLVCFPGQPLDQLLRIVGG